MSVSKHSDNGGNCTAMLSQPSAQREQSANMACPACDSATMEPFFDLGQLPVQVGTRWPTAEAAKSCPQGYIHLAFCPACSFVANVAFRPELLDYNDPYDNYLGYSPTFQRFEEDLARRLVETYDIRNKNVLEIGCGLGSFVRSLCAAGHNQGWGFDPSIVTPGVERSSGVEFVRGYYPNDEVSIPADMIVCRQVFEHVPRPFEFLRKLRESIGDRRDTVLYVEVPGFDDVLRRVAIWMMIYEHCNYFGRVSLAGIFERSGFEVLDVHECYDNTFVAVEAKPSVLMSSVTHAAAVDHEGIPENIMSFLIQSEEKISLWRGRIQDLARAGRRVVAWGAGARAVAFFNLLGIKDEVPYIVDISPNKASCYLPGTGQQIVPPSFLAEYRPDVVIIINSVYRDEIAKQVESLGLKVEYLCP